MNNLPTIVPKATRPTISAPRSTTKARNRYFVDPALNQNVARSSKDTAGEADEATYLRQKLKEMEEKHCQEVDALNVKVKELQDKVILLESQAANSSFTLQAVKGNKKMFQFYTGLPDYATFKLLFDSFGNAVDKLNYYQSNTNTAKLSEKRAKRGPKRRLSPEEEFFIVLVRLRCGLLEKDLSYRVGISAGHLSRICITWFDFLHHRFRQYPIWSPRHVIDATMPECFCTIYPTTRVIIDATELYIEMPSSLRSQSITYSSYKHYNTAKGLVGISPSGYVTFVSDLYAGKTSDKALTKDCGLYSLLENGDSVMADKGFTIEDDLPVGVTLNIPPFLGDAASLTVAQENQTRQIASLRVHVERVIRRIKVFRIIKYVFPLSMAATLNHIWIICAYLTNFLPPLGIEGDEVINADSDSEDDGE